MASIRPTKKRKAASDPPLDANLSLANLNKLIDQRVADAARALTSRVDGLQRENQGLLLRCESLERSVQVLKKEGSWTYSAPDVPRSHWAEQGHAYANDATSLVRSIKTRTQDLRSDSGDEVDVGTITRILPDTALGPHWEQLANAIQLSERIKTIFLHNVQLDQSTLQMIERSVRQKGTTGICLYSNQFLGGEGVKFAIDTLKSNRSTARFYWEDNSFHNTEHACDLIDAILEHPTVNDLVLRGCSLNENIIPVQRLFGGAPGTDTLINIDLSENRLRTNGDRCIPDFLSTNPPLETLDLKWNRLTDDDAIHIAQALQYNTNLRVLDLDDNALTEEGTYYMCFLSVLGLSRPDVSALMTGRGVNFNSVRGANHTCEIRGIVSETAFMNRHDESAKSNRRRKLFELLVNNPKRQYRGCTISQLESELSEDGMRLLPHVIACISTYSVNCSQEQCLSLLFELARDWKTPEIYQLRQT